jgi:NDP-4-keto-2,6-dideoxyhexose 3-C-methyltransferase
MVFKNYPYLSGTTATMKGILKDVVDEGAQLVKLEADDVVLDIGGNDGTMLSYLDVSVAAKVNIDTAEGVKSVRVSGNYKRVEGAFTSDLYKKLGLPKPKLIFSVAMFYHLDNPLTFCKDVASIMDDDSLWIIQMTYLGSMLESNIYDNIVHEHKAYYSIHSLEYLLELASLYICGARVVESYGGSIRVFVSKKQRKIEMHDLSQEYENIKKEEIRDGINTNRALELFNDRIQVLRSCAYNLVRHVHDAEGKLIALGASTKGNMMCQFSGIDHQLIECVLDNNEKKIGKVMTGSDIPIVNEEEWLGRLSKYLLVLPYYYIDYFTKMVSQNTRTGDTNYLIVLLPFPKVIQVKGEG